MKILVIGLEGAVPELGLVDLKVGVVLGESSPLVDVPPGVEGDPGRQHP